MTLPRSSYLTQSVTFTGKRLVIDPDTGKPVEDRYGNDTYADTPFTVPDCSWNPRGSSFENVDQGKAEQVDDDLTLYCTDPQVDVRPTDEATIDGVLYQVQGRPQRFTGSRFGNDHAVVVLKRVTG